MNKEICRADLRRDYETYLRRQCGLSERTIFHSWRIADRFLEFRFGKENGELSRITTSDIVGFLQHLTTRTPPQRAIFAGASHAQHAADFLHGLQKSAASAQASAVSKPDIILIGGRAFRWQEICEPRRQQLEAWKAAQPRQLALFELKEDRRPASERTAAGRYAEPTLSPTCRRCEKARDDCHFTSVSLLRVQESPPCSR
jgi:hypothetical protein